MDRLNEDYESTKISTPSSPPVYMRWLNDDCPKCGDEGAYFDGLCWTCPNCNHSWGCV